MSSNKTKWNSLGDFLKAKEEREKEPPAPEPPTPVTPVTPVPPVTPVKEVVAPARDFARVANSVVRDAVPAGIFTGKGKQLYDYLYSRTRGAIVPSRSARIPTDQVMKGAGMTRHTYRAHIHRLISFGLVEVQERPGEHGGNIYTVHLPEEAEANRGDIRHRGDRGDRGHTGEKVPGVQGSQVHPGHRGLSVEDSRVSGEPKTSFKINTENDDDDAALAGVFAALKRANKEITGKDLSRADADRWREVADVIVAELKIAAARTTVSNVPAFLAEHLRRRLWKIDRKQASAEGKELPDQSVSTTAQEDVKACPDCGGSGWWYPEGADRGVKKCRHEKLKERTGEAD
ncbi:MAG TPA: hypothetical protein VN256_22440 [Pyrinomonadaceae bacterium]|nr:hypothetical protein [Pyrinomonadaceae bacterium]